MGGLVFANQISISIPGPRWEDLDALVWAAAGSKYMFTGVATVQSDHEFLAQHEGYGTPTFTTDADGLLPDWEYNYYTVVANDPPVWGARRVENLVTYSEDLTNGAYSVANGAVVDSAQQATFDGTSNGKVQRTNVISATSTGRSFIFSVELKLISGTPSGDAALQLLMEGGIAGLGDEISSEWQRFAVSHTTAGTDVDTEVRWDDAGVLGIRNWQVEEVTGQTDTTNPGEYVPTEATSAYKFYSNLNGNTVASNVVTEAVGLPLSTMPSLYAAPALTNSCLYSNDFTQTWSMSGSAEPALDAAGLTGAPNTASTITDGDAGAHEFMHQPVTVSNDGATHTVVGMVKKDTDETRFALVGMGLLGGTQLLQLMHLNTKTGAFANETSNNDGTSEVNSRGEWWECICTLTNNTSGNVTLRAYAQGGRATVIGTGDVAATGSAIYGNMSIFLNTTIAQCRNATPIITEGSSVTASAGTLVYDIANHDDTKGLYTCTFTPMWSDTELNATFGLINSRSTAGASQVYSQNDSKVVTYDETTSVGSSDTAFVAGTPYFAAVGYNAADSFMFAQLEGNRSSDTAYDGAYSVALGAIQLLNSMDAPGLIQNVRKYALDYSPGKTQATTLATYINPDYLTLDLPLQTTLVPDYAAGSDTATFARASGATVNDFEGLVKTTLSGEARFLGARRVENLIPTSNNLGSFSGSGELSFVDNTTYASAELDSTSTSRIQDTNVIAATEVGRTYTLSFEAKYTSGLSSTLNPRLKSSDNIINDSIVLTTDWVRYSGTGTILTSASLNIEFRNGDSAAGTLAFDIRNVQLQDVSGQAITAPSEYVSTDVESAPYHGADVDGVKYFKTANANTVTDNVVSDLNPGAAFDGTDSNCDASGPHGYVSESALTNTALYSNDGTQWTITNGCINLLDQPGLTGAANTATYLEDDDASAFENIEQDITIPADTNTYTFRAFILKDTDETAFPECQMIMGGNNVLAQINTKTGATANRAETGATSTSVIDKGLWWELVVSLVNPSATTATLRVFPAVSISLGGAAGVGNQRSIVLGQYEFYQDATIQDVKGRSVIFTEGSSVTRAADSLTYDDALNVYDFAGTAYAEVSSFWATCDGDQRSAISRAEFDSRIIYNETGVSSDRIYSRSVGGGQSISPTGTTYQNSPQAAAGAWGGGYQQAYYQGAPDATPSAEGTGHGTGPIRVGARGASEQWDGTTRFVQLYRTELTETLVGELPQ